MNVYFPQTILMVHESRLVNQQNILFYKASEASQLSVRTFKRSTNNMTPKNLNSYTISRGTPGVTSIDSAPSVGLVTNFRNDWSATNI